MRWLLAAIFVIHGLIHLMGSAKAFGLAELPQLTQPISRPMGLVWLLATLLVVGAAAAMLLAPRWWWLLAVAAACVSQVAIASAWQDAKYGSLANVLLLVAAIYSVLQANAGEK